MSTPAFLLLSHAKMSVTTRQSKASLQSIFTSFGPPNEVHSDRGGAFVSKNFVEFLTLWGVRVSKTTSYHPQGNAQCERYNGVIWRTIQSRLLQAQLSKAAWDDEVGLVLANIRIQVCEATGMTPHERLFNFRRRSAFFSPKTRVDWAPLMVSLIG